MLSDRAWLQHRASSIRGRDDNEDVWQSVGVKGMKHFRLLSMFYIFWAQIGPYLGWKGCIHTPSSSVYHRFAKQSTIFKPVYWNLIDGGKKWLQIARHGSSMNIFWCLRLQSAPQLSHLRCLQFQNSRTLRSVFQSHVPHAENHWSETKRSAVIPPVMTYLFWSAKLCLTKFSISNWVKIKNIISISC